MPYVNQRWLGGMLTNFSTVSGRVKRMQELRTMQAAGDFDAMPKKEALRHVRELEKLSRNLGGIAKLERLPDAIFVIDTKKEHIAVTEANKLKMPVVAVVDTNCDPDVIDYVIPGNDDAIRSGRLMCRVIADAVTEGRWIASHRPAPKAARQRRAAERPEQPAPAAGPALGRAAGAARPGGRIRTDGAPRTAEPPVGGPPAEVAPSPEPAPAADRHPRRRPGRRHRVTGGGVTDGRLHRQGHPGPAPGDRRGHARRQAGAEENDGDMEEAAQWLRVQGLAGAAKRADREASQGAVAVVRRGPVGAVVELRCETDFVAKSAEFVVLADELAAWWPPRARRRWPSARRDGPTAHTLKENISVGRRVASRPPPARCSTPTSTSTGRGINGVLIVLRGGARSSRTTSPSTSPLPGPTYLRREDVPEAEVAAERATVEEISRNEGKPETALPQDRRGSDERLVQGARACSSSPTPATRSRRGRSSLGCAEVVRFAQVVIGS